MEFQIIHELMRELAKGSIATQAAAGHDPVSPARSALVWAILLELAPEFAVADQFKLIWSVCYGIEYCKWKIMHDREMEDDGVGSSSNEDESESEAEAEADTDADAEAEAVAPDAAPVDIIPQI